MTAIENPNLRLEKDIENVVCMDDEKKDGNGEFYF